MLAETASDSPSSLTQLEQRSDQPRHDAIRLLGSAFELSSGFGRNQQHEDREKGDRRQREARATDDRGVRRGLSRERRARDADGEEGQHGEHIEEPLSDDRSERGSEGNLLAAGQQSGPQDLANPPREDRRGGEPENRCLEQRSEGKVGLNGFEQGAPAERAHGKVGELQGGREQ